MMTYKKRDPRERPIKPIVPSHEREHHERLEGSEL
jgi:hypothetical protein